MLFPLHIPLPRRVTNALVNLLVKIRAMSEPERPSRTRHIPLNYITVPLVSVLVLLASGAIDGSVIKRGIIGADGVKPINIMALFISLVRRMMLSFGHGILSSIQAYMSISLDFTGLLRFSAFWVARKGGSSGKLLYLYLYAFFLVCGVIVGNVSHTALLSASPHQHFW